jgi:hypothetical protein
MSHVDLPEELNPPAPPIGEIFAETYRHIWRYRWPYLGQVAIWTVMMWLRVYPVLMISDVLGQAGLVWVVADHDLVFWFLASATRLLFLMLGGGLIFLSSACAILFARRPRAGDALRLPAVKGFWLVACLFWILADTIALLTLNLFVLYISVSGEAPLWLSPYVARIGILVYPVVMWALIGLALPIAAFETSATPFHAAWERLRDRRPNAVVLFGLVAAPIVAPQALGYLVPIILGPLSIYSFYLELMPLHDAFPLLRTALSISGIFLFYLMIVVLSVSTTLVYRRLSPGPTEIAREFD